MITLTREEVRSLIMVLDLDSEIRDALNSISDGGNLDEDLADELRDLCNDKIDVCGYDENYKLNNIGKKLEALADKLYTG